MQTPVDTSDSEDTNIRDMLINPNNCKLTTHVSPTYTYMMSLLRLRVFGRLRLATILLFLLLSSLFVFLINSYSYSPAEPIIKDDILDPRYLKQQETYRKKMANKFHFDQDEAPVQLCKVPTLTLKSDANQFDVHSMDPLDCDKEDLFTLKDGLLRMKPEVLGKRKLTHCLYKAIEWETDFSHRYSEPMERKAPGPYELKIKNEFFHVECYLEKPNGTNEEMTSSERELREHYGGMRKLLQAKDDKAHQDRWQVASDKVIRNVVQNNDLGNKRIGDIVHKVQYEQSGPKQSLQNPNLNPINNNQQQVGGKIPFVNTNINGQRQNVQNPLLKPGNAIIPGQLSNTPGTNPDMKNPVWGSPPRYMGSVGLPDSPLIGQIAKQVYNTQKEIYNKAPNNNIQQRPVGKIAFGQQQGQNRNYQGQNGFVQQNQKQPFGNMPPQNQQFGFVGQNPKEAFGNAPKQNQQFGGQELNQNAFQQVPTQNYHQQKWHAGQNPKQVFGNVPNQNQQFVAIKQNQNAFQQVPNRNDQQQKGYVAENQNQQIGDQQQNQNAFQQVPNRNDQQQKGYVAQNQNQRIGDQQQNQNAFQQAPARNDQQREGYAGQNQKQLFGNVPNQQQRIGAQQQNSFQQVPNRNSQQQNEYAGQNNIPPNQAGKSAHIGQQNIPVHIPTNQESNLGLNQQQGPQNNMDGPQNVAPIQQNNVPNQQDTKQLKTPHVAKSTTQKVDLDKSIDLNHIPESDKPKPAEPPGEGLDLKKIELKKNESDKVVDAVEKVTQDPNYENVDSLNIPSMYSEFDYHDYNFEMADFEQFFAQIVPKEDVLKRVREVPKVLTQMNVLMLGLDSMSNMMYQRKLPKTYAYLQNSLKSVILKGYNIVGDATTAAIIPLTTGHTEAELPEVRKNQEGSTFVDAYPLIWNKFEQRGYVTLYTEDKPDIATFNLRLNGFEEIPVDHYMRPWYQAVLKSSMKEASASYCTGGRPSHEHMLEYLMQLFDRYPSDVNKFGFGFMSDLSHDDNNPSEYLDEDLVNMLEHLRKRGHLDNTVVIIMADHGARYSSIRKTTQGKLEERLPMMSLAFPPWFQKKYPHLMENLRTNADRLTTPFDIHATLLSIVDLLSLKKPPKKGLRGLSLLRPHPINRTCSDAGVEAHWCTCMNWQQIDPTNWRVQKAASVLVEYINSRSTEHRDICSQLSLKAVADVKIGLPNEKVLKYLQSSDGDQRVANFTQDLKSDLFYLQLIVETLPGHALYEATLTLSDGGQTYKVVPGISRINKYGSQAHCVTENFPDLRIFCHCNTPPPTKSPVGNQQNQRLWKNSRTGVRQSQRQGHR